MIKTEVETRTKEVRTHHFYCDDCNKYLGKSQEYDDGWYQDLREFNVQFGEYHISKHLCDDCKERFSERLGEMLIELGFEKN